MFLNTVPLCVEILEKNHGYLSVLHRPAVELDLGYLVVLRPHIYALFLSVFTYKPGTINGAVC